MSKDIFKEGMGEKMKVIITTTMILLLMITGCSKEVEVCNYQPFIDQNTNLMNQNTQCQTERNVCNVDLVEQKAINNQLKIQILNNNSAKDCIPTSCNTVVRLLNQKENELEDCWMNANATVYVTNHTEFNQTLYDLYTNCSDWRDAINESLN